ncbi:unnamed protein product [Rotaria magnacalcarata]
MFRHITIYHQSEPRFQLTCNLNVNCGVVYRTYSAYKSHIYRHHQSLLNSSENPACNINSSIESTNQQDDVNASADVDVVYDDTENQMYETIDNYALDILALDNENDLETKNTLVSTIKNSKNKLVSMLDIKKSFVSFILQLREEYLLPKYTTDTISCCIITLINLLRDLIEVQTLVSGFDPSGSSPQDNTLINQCIELKKLNDIMNSVCDEIKSISKNEYQFLKSCEQFFDYSPPEEVIVSNKDEDIEKAYYIPIDKTLSLLLQSQAVLTETLENIQQQQLSVKIDDDLMFSYRDGSHGSRVDDKSFLIQLYLDDIGVTNPLGAKKDQHKMTMLYFSLEDIPDKYRSRLDFIHLLGICSNNTLKDGVKANRFFTPIIENLNQLQTKGLIINGRHLNFSFSTMVADNLAAHVVGGFQLSFTHGYFCRRCLIKYSDKNLPISANKARSRTIIDHDKIVQQIVHNNHASPFIDVIGASPLQNLIDFHSTISLPGDALVASLKDLLIAFHASMVSYFPRKLVPKVHFVCEYDEIINDFGSVKKYWYCRYEASHAYFKKIAMRSGNFKNVPKMLATRYSLKQTFRLSRLFRFNDSNYALGIKAVKDNLFSTKIKHILIKHFGPIDFENDLIQCKSLSHENIEYHKSSVYIIGLRNSDEQPLFGQIASILKKEEKWWLLMDKLETIVYDEQLFAWKLESINKFCVVDPYDLEYYHQGLDIYEINNASYVSFIGRFTLH